MRSSRKHCSSMREIHPQLKNRYFWTLLLSLVDYLPSLEPFDGRNSRQRKNNRGKYKTFEKLVSKLSGCGSAKSRLHLKIKSEFLTNHFPNCFELS